MDKSTILRIFNKILNGSGRQVSRLRTLNGTTIELSEVFQFPRLLLERILVSDKREPWLNRSAIKYFEDLLTHKFHLQARVLEIGGGGSTPWLAKRSEYLVTIEENESFGKLLLGIPTKLVIGDTFIESMRALKSEKFDIVFIDGGSDIQRREILEFTLTNLSATLVILDNSDREIFREFVTHSEKYLVKTFSGMLSRPFQMSSTTFWQPLTE